MSVRMQRGAALIADENRELLAEMVHALRDEGFCVLAASSSEQLASEARYLSAYATEFVLIVVSERLTAPPWPGLVGVLGMRARRRYQRVAVVLTSEPGSERPHPAALPCSPVLVLRKPFNVRRLQSFARSLIANAGHSWLQGQHVAIHGSEGSILE